MTNERMKIALGQFAVTPAWQENAATCLDLVARSKNHGADLLVLPEGILARDAKDPEIVLKTAQPVDGPFVQQLLDASCGSEMTVMMTIHTPAQTGKVWNIHIAIRNGEILAQYRKLHLYDAFLDKESTNVVPGNEVPDLITVAGFKVGLMTCYDVRFPELARCLVLNGADVLTLPAAWVKGPLKESHWDILVRARALENTCYLVAVGECGDRNIGHSMVVDPFGVAIAHAAEAPALIFAEIDRARLVHARNVLPVLENRRFAKPHLTNPTRN